MLDKCSFLERFNKEFLELTNSENVLPIEFGSMSSTRAYFMHDGDKALKFKFSNILLDGRLADKDVIKIMRHEIAHFIVFNEFGNKPKDAHGDEFYNACINNNIEFFVGSSFEFLHNNFVRLECSKCGKTLKEFRGMKSGMNFIQNKKIKSKCCLSACILKDKE